jgi:predicted HicB family RNase H-like nuclease
MSQIKHLVAPVSPEYHRRVRHAAAELDISVAELVRRAVREFLVRWEREASEGVPEEDASG